MKILAVIYALSNDKSFPPQRRRVEENSVTLAADSCGHIRDKDTGCPFLLE
jgi:hypothetical protein